MQSEFPALVQSFFVERLANELNASSNTIASYRDTFRLILRYAQEKLKKAPYELQMDDLSETFVTAFLGHLEDTRGNGPHTRNVRLAAIHSFFRYAAFRCPEKGALIQRVMAIPSKRSERTEVTFLTRPEATALIGAPDQSTWQGQRDRTLLVTTLQTGMRVSEVVSRRKEHVHLATPGAHISVLGKGRKHRSIPLRKDALTALDSWFAANPCDPEDPLFPNARGTALSRSGVDYILAKHLVFARKQCSSLTTKRVSMHVLRHTTAMELLQAGVSLVVIALWLGHESLDTTRKYLKSDPRMKEKALAKTTPFGAKARRYRPSDPLIEFLDAL